MAKFTIRHSCGHVEEVQLYGKESERPARARRMADEPCRECRRERERERAAEQAAALGLPGLEGSERQVAWALVIRMEAYGTLRDLADISTAERIAEERGATDEQLAEIARWGRAAVSVVAARTDAAWWIEHRTGAALDLLHELRALMRGE